MHRAWLWSMDAGATNDVAALRSRATSRIRAACRSAPASVRRPAEYESARPCVPHSLASAFSLLPAQQVQSRFLSARSLATTASQSDPTSERSSLFRRRGGLRGSGSPTRCCESGELGSGASPATRSQLSSLAFRSPCTALRAPWLSGDAEGMSTWCAMQTYAGSRVTARWRSSASRETLHRSLIRPCTRRANKTQQPTLAPNLAIAAERQRR